MLHILNQMQYKHQNLNRASEDKLEKITHFNLLSDNEDPNKNKSTFIFTLDKIFGPEQINKEASYNYDGSVFVVATGTSDTTQRIITHAQNSQKEFDENINIMT